MTTEQRWAWPETMDARLAAPASHRVLLENDRVRVLEVVIEPRAREPEHTHQAASVMIVDEPARIRYHVGSAMQFESPEHSGALPAVRMSWMEPESPHSVENIDERRPCDERCYAGQAVIQPDTQGQSPQIGGELFTLHQAPSPL